ncbi:Dihydrolipoyllysine-residue succinyltransferase component of 2-oxoglutarate dehydrogenase complex, partial [Haemophilus influenzae]
HHKWWRVRFSYVPPNYQSATKCDFRDARN